MKEEVLSKKYGEPYDIATNVFKEFEGKDFRSNKLRTNLTAQ